MNFESRLAIIARTALLVSVCVSLAAAQFDLSLEVDGGLRSCRSISDQATIPDTAETTEPPDSTTAVPLPDTARFTSALLGLTLTPSYVRNLAQAWSLETSADLSADLYARSASEWSAAADVALEGDWDKRKAHIGLSTGLFHQPQVFEFDQPSRFINLSATAAYERRLKLPVGVQYTFTLVKSIDMARIDLKNALRLKLSARPAPWLSSQLKGGVSVSSSRGTSGATFVDFNLIPSAALLAGEKNMVLCMVFLSLRNYAARKVATPANGETAVLRKDEKDNKKDKEDKKDKDAPLVNAKNVNLLFTDFRNLHTQSLMATVCYTREITQHLDLQVSYEFIRYRALGNTTAASGASQSVFSSHRLSGGLGWRLRSL